MAIAHQKKFDMLRGVSSIAVLLAHCAQCYLYRLWGPGDPKALFCGAVARHAVLVFFLLSGFLITQSLLANVRRNGRLDVNEYLIARIVRIYPPLIGAIVLAVLVGLLINGLNLPGGPVRYGLEGDLYVIRDRFAVNATDVLLALLLHNGMLKVNGPLWALYVECHLYVVAMLLTMAIVATHGVRRILSMLGISILVVLWTVLDPQMLIFGIVWGLGAAAAIYRDFVRDGRYKRVLSPLAWGIVVAFAATALLSPGWLAVNKWTPLSVSTQMLACIAYIYFIFLADNVVKQPADWLARTGGFSYSLYVIHSPLLLFMLSLTQAWMGASVTRSIVVCLGAATAALVAAYWFSRLFEEKRYFKPLVEKGFQSLSALFARNAPRAR